ncbi:MAG: glutamine synthetase type III [Flavobacteriia bacterium]|nr:glutamine synthetase type III [Flavobacteriia bacterium]
MANHRFQSLETATQRPPVELNIPDGGIPSYFGEMVFNRKAMRDYLGNEAYKSVVAAMELGKKIDRSMADQIASGMKAWALNKGATHYTHWFQPLTGATAEKHDSFFEPTFDGQAMEKFDGSLLVQQEPDASSFPNGGIRNTFEARGYTAWDPTSAAFIMGTTLCIPTIFVAYTGEALDYKTPLLRALQVVDQAATDVCKYFDKNVNKVTSTLGWEQEYFLVDNALFKARPDLQQTGRTLLGHSPAKGQQLDDHYFGTIPERVMRFMQEFEYEAHRLGIPIKTRHNEVAPGQYEMAPIFEEANLAVDHNSLIMDVVEKVARRHGLRCLLHEKPFAGVNGSGKHNNWSLATDTGVNLLSPGKNPMGNLQFLTFFINTIKAVHRHADLLRSIIASAGNDHRLGANEAPPAIISVFIGSQLSAVLDELEKIESGKLSAEKKTELKLNVVGKIPEILLDNTDRNRTSPFAFTGNKFELRAVGSSANCAAPMTILNAIVAQQLKDFKSEVDALIDKKGLKKDDAIFNVLKEYIKSSKSIRFEGDGYSGDWEKEAEKRGLSNVRTTPHALDFFVSKDSIQLFEDLGVMNRTEIEARHEIMLENYQLKIQIESRVLGDISGNHLVPTALRYQTLLMQNIQGMHEVFGDKEFKKLTKVPRNMVQEIAERTSEIITLKEEMIEARKRANAVDDVRKRSIMYCEEVLPYFEKIRVHSDKLELLIDDEVWTLPKYREMLSLR